MVHNSDSDQKPGARQDKKPGFKREGAFADKAGPKKAFGGKPGFGAGKDGKGKPSDKPAFKPKDIQDQKTGERIAKVLARAGIASRREIERLIGLGKIAVNGRILDTPAVLVTPEDVVTIDGQAIGAAEPTRLWRYHKPVGLMTTHKDPAGRPTVFDDLPADLPRVISVGRLDLNSEGLLLLTNDGELARALELPSSGWVRRYRARAHGHTTQERLDKLKDGITVEGVSYGAIEAKLDKAVSKADGRSNNWISVALNEGKNREVRKVLGALDLQVNRLIRMAYGPFLLGDLAVGAVEEVGPRVIRELLADIVPLGNLPPEGASQTASRSPKAEGAGRRGGGDRFQARDKPQTFQGKRTFGGEKAFGDKRPPRDGDHPYRSREAGEGDTKPFVKKTYDKKPFEKPPYEKKSWGDRGNDAPKAEGAGFKPKRTYGETPRDGKPYGDKPHEGKPRGDRPYAAKEGEGRFKPRGPRAEGERSFSDRPKPKFSGPRGEGNPDGFKGSAYRGAAGKPEGARGGKPGGFKSGPAKPSGGKPFAGKTFGKPGGSRPGGPSRSKPKA